MHAQPHVPPPEIRLSEAETIAYRYRRAAKGDAWVALVRAIEDGLADLDEAQARAGEQRRLVSRGYARLGRDG